MIRKCFQNSWHPDHTVFIKDISIMSNVETVCTTDDLADDLKYHIEIAKSGFKTKVYPTTRSDKLIEIGKETSLPYIKAIEEEDIYKTDILSFCSKEYVKYNWTMQLNIGALRNNNQKMYNLLGADVGFDSINDLCIAEKYKHIVTVNAKNYIQQYPESFYVDNIYLTDLGNIMFANNMLRDIKRIFK